MNVDNEIKQIDKAISELVYPKTQLIKAYNYYHGKRDPEQFRHIEENFGIGIATGIAFNPLVRPHIDRLVGEYLGLSQDLKISCKDKSTMTNIMRDKQALIAEETSRYLKKFLENNIIANIIADKEITVDPFIEKQLNKIKEDINESYVSEYEIAAQNILTYLKQSQNIDLDSKMQSLLTDLCISGTCYYRVRPSISGDNIQLEVLNPLNTFVEKNPNSNYLSDSYRSVVKRFMSIEDILMEYAEYLTDDHIEILQNAQSPERGFDGDAVYITATSPNLQSAWNNNHKGILGGLEVHPFWDGTTTHTPSINMWDVYDVEWLEVDYHTGKQTRHEGTRIGNKIYITKGASQYQLRTKDNPNKCRLTVNGMFFLDKNGEPNSMILKTESLQDRYDLLCFYRDNLIANSGCKGDFIDVALLPTYLGNNVPERLQKWIAYKKQGIALLDTSQDGIQGSPLNTIFNGFDDTVRAESINAINMAMQTIQQQVSLVTGVLPEAMAQYEQRDAVSNVQLGVKTTMLLTKQIFKAMDVVYKAANYDMLNLAKLVWPKGLTGTIVLGNLSKIFTALPKYYTTTDFDVHIEDSAKSYQNVQSLVAISGELIKSGAADLGDITSIMTTDSITELKRTVNQSIAKRKEENDAVAQLQNQLQQYEQTVKEMSQANTKLQQQLQQLQNQLQQNNQNKLQLEAEKLVIEKEKVKNEKDYNDKTIDVKQKQIEAQVAQMFDQNPYNDKIKAVVG